MDGVVRFVYRGLLHSETSYMLSLQIAIKVRVLPTDLATRLQLRGIYLIEIKDCDMCLLDYITMTEINKWPFKQIRR